MLTQFIVNSHSAMVVTAAWRKTVKVRRNLSSPPGGVWPSGGLGIPCSRARPYSPWFILMTSATSLMVT